MTVEAFVFLGIVLLVWFIASIGSWLREQIERYTRYQDELSLQETFLPSPVFESVRSDEATAELPELILPRCCSQREPETSHPVTLSESNSRAPGNHPDDGVRSLQSARDPGRILILRRGLLRLRSAPPVLSLSKGSGRTGASPVTLSVRRHAPGVEGRSG